MPLLWESNLRQSQEFSLMSTEHQKCFFHQLTVHRTLGHPSGNGKRQIVPSSLKPRSALEAVLNSWTV
jgi:hypothetical protein